MGSEQSPTELLITSYAKTLAKFGGELREMSLGLSNLLELKEPNYKYIVSLIPEAETRKQIDMLRRELEKANSRIKTLTSELHRVVENKADNLMLLKKAFGCGYLARSDGKDFDREWGNFLSKKV